jgi:hypothetical protein
MMIDNIMSDLSEFNVPWKSEIDSGLINQTSLDFGYFSRSANKMISPAVYDLSGSSVEDFHIDVKPLTHEQRTRLAGTLYTLFNRKWARLWDAYKVEYNPISNYDMTETENSDTIGTESGTNTGTVSIDNDSTVTDNKTLGGTRSTVTDNDTSQTGTVNDTGTNNINDGVFGFNSSDSVGSNTRDGNSTNNRVNDLHGTEDTTETETRNLTDNTTTTTDATETETRNLADSKETNTSNERTLTRRGNIGVTTTQQMLESELQLWQWNFFISVFDDIDSICCLDVY